MAYSGTPRKLFAAGAIGDAIYEIQLALLSSASNLKSADRIYGQETRNAVREFQAARSLAVTGDVDDVTWLALMQRPVLAVGDRCLQLTAAFEGHGFGLAVGNFDGALLTWGIIGFTMKSGEVQAIVQAIQSAYPDLVKKTFGEESDELLRLISGEADFQKQWADDHTLKSGALAEPWRSMFASFGSLPAVQAEQIKRVQADYLNPAIATARKLGFTSELGLALCFDIQVQNGGIKKAPLKTLLQQAQNNKPELELRELAANAVADSAKAAWREDVRRRKLTVARGLGTVHGHNYALEDWGLSGEFAAAELMTPDLQASAA
jgi:Putative peptidoglycan binding domain/Glycosyl hydrolase family 46